jgi:solute:Na+ symporter, SSS family
MLQPTDWVVLVATLILIIFYGIYKSRTTRDLDGYFRSNRQLPWYLVLLSIMGTQASAITFLSAPGQAYTDGMRFVQYYLGLPLAMIVICVSFVPLFQKLNLFTAYEFLQKRFDLKTRTFTSFLFLVSRGLSTGISVVAPSLVVSSLLGWNIYYTNTLMGGLLIIYTVSGGARAVAYTQQLQLIIIFAGMFLAGWYAVKLLPSGVGFQDALHTGGVLGKMNIITDGMKINADGSSSFNWNDRYNIISGLIGGFFLAWSYFGTDQSQVGRYLTARSLRESRLGLLMNGLVKVPMQFSILLVGVLVFAFYQYNSSPIHFNQKAVDKILNSPFRNDALRLIDQYAHADSLKQVLAEKEIHSQGHLNDSLRVEQAIVNKQMDSLRNQFSAVIHENDKRNDGKDINYIFLYFVTHNLPVGLVGLLIAMIFLASWGSIAAALNSLASATIVDFHKVFSSRKYTDEQEYRLSKIYTLVWGLFCILAAQFATNMGSLIEAVNVLGSLFYGVILGIFITAFYIKRVGGDAVFWAAVLGEFTVCFVHFGLKFSGFLWLNVLGALVVIVFALIMQLIIGGRRKL